MKVDILLLLAMLLTGCAHSSSDPAVSSPKELGATVYRNNSTSDAQGLTAKQAKAIFIARAVGVDSPGTGNDLAIYEEYKSPDKVVYEVRQVADGWYVFCHGPDTSRGGLAHVDNLWRVERLTYGSRNEFYNAR